MNEDILDAEELLEECEDDKVMLARWVEIFARDYDERLPRLREAVSGGDSATVMNEAHAIKGSVGTFFAVASFQTAQQLETMGREGDTAAAEQVLQQLESEIVALRQAMSEIIG